VNVLAAYCAHGKLRAVMTVPDKSSKDHRGSDEYRKEFNKYRRSISLWAHKTEYITVEAARSGDFDCQPCDAAEGKE